MLVKARWLFDGRSQSSLPQPVVEIEEGRIVRVLDFDAVAGGSGAIVELGEVTVMPGLIDGHQHLGFDASTDPVSTFTTDSDAALLLRMRLSALKALAAGITTIRDLGDRSYLGVELRNWFRQGVEIGPEILAAGPPITVSGGHCWFMGGEADGIEGVRQAVREHAARGVDVIKIMVTGGNMTPTIGPHESQYTLDEIRAVVEEAHAHGLLVAAHGHGSDGITNSLAAGVDSIEHCTFFNADGVDSGHATIAELGRSQTFVSLTGGRVPGDYYIPPAILQRLPATNANHKLLYESGARIVCGTDAGIARSKPHDVLPHAVTGFLPALGMSNDEVLSTVTSRAAEACGVADRKGRVSAGLDADLIAVDGNVVEDLTRIHKVVAVFRAGRRVELAAR